MEEEKRRAKECAELTQLRPVEPTDVEDFDTALGAGEAEQLNNSQPGLQQCFFASCKKDLKTSSNCAVRS